MTRHQPAQQRGKGIRKSSKCQEARRAALVPADGRTGLGLGLVTLEVEAAPPAPGVAALRQRTALLPRLGDSGGARTTERKEQEAAIFRRDPAIFGGQPDRRKRGSARPTSRGRPRPSASYPVRSRLGSRGPYAEGRADGGGSSRSAGGGRAAPETVHFYLFSFLGNLLVHCLGSSICFSTLHVP